MVINIAASHRFHLLDLARELESLGHDVRFYSYVPTKRAMSFGLKNECSYSFLGLVLPLLLLIKLSKRSEWSVKLINWTMDFYVSNFMKSCDVFIGLGTVYKDSFVSAKKKFNATTILEWGSKHIEEQQRILSEIPGFKVQDSYFTKRSLEGYANSDFIAIASDHVKKSFIDKGICEKKLLQNPYGVDLSMFSATKLDGQNNYDVIMVGGWSYRKGCDLLIEFFKTSNLTFVHVGPIIDLEFPKMSNMTHFGFVDQSELIHFYKKAKVFVLPSREEGLAMVQSQAVICGLPIVCSKDSGGRDLRSFLIDKKWIIEMNSFSVIELSYSINKALDLAQTQTDLRNYSDNVINSLTWKAYGKRYDHNLRNFENNIVL
jgi:glycosyltransferase involved in cell wall biosynthesis